MQEGSRGVVVPRAPAAASKKLQRWMQSPACISRLTQSLRGRACRVLGKPWDT